MKFLVKSSDVQGKATIPSSKSNTTRGVIFATLAEGQSVLRNALPSRDCLSTVSVCRGVGAEVETNLNTATWTIKGTGPAPSIPNGVLDVGNSGTTLYFMMALSALNPSGWSVLTGDYQICRRPAAPLIQAINALGGSAFSTRDNGSAPVVIKGRMKGGSAELPGINSQWLTPLLSTAPLLDEDTHIDVKNLMERGYVQMTLDWMARSGVKYANENFEHFTVYGRQQYLPFDAAVPGDWESAAFVLVAAAITNSEVEVYGLDLNDAQEDKQLVDILKAMGADISVIDPKNSVLCIRGGRQLKGLEIDCCDLPDMPPALAVLATQAAGKTVLYNLEASRLKETNRPKSITEELQKMGAHIVDDGKTVTIEQSDLHGALIDGHHDHRIVMATTVAGLVAQGPTIVDHAEYAAISFPNFYEVMTNLGASIQRVQPA